MWRWTYRGAVVVALTAMLAAGCGTRSATDTPTPSGSRSSSAPGVVWPSPVSVTEFCGGTVPAGVDQRQLTAAGATLNTAWLGSGKTTAVLLHQTDGNGLCGFLFFADFLRRKNVRVALLDLCGYGQSHCEGRPLARDPGAQVKLVTDAARVEGASRVVVVGASMGGSVAVTAARAARPDAIVDLSGPAEFNTSAIARDAGKVTMPALFAFAHTDQADLTAVRLQLPRMPTTRKVFLTYDAGHGYDLLRDLSSGDFTPLASKVAPGWLSPDRSRPVAYDAAGCAARRIY